MLDTQKNTIAFALDIDGVLVKGTQAIPGAHETIKMLQDNNVPFIFLTNGGGLTEKAHVVKLGQRLDLALSDKQFVQSHTPFHDLVPEYKDKTILVLGGHGQQIRELAHAYGFNRVITSSDLMGEWKHIHPFPELTMAHHAEHAKVIANPQTVEIAAIMVWSSPRDWCLDLQVVVDLLLSSGRKFGQKPVSPLAEDISLPNFGYLQDKTPKLFFCNPDFEWATQYEHPRFAQGAFREALNGVWAHATRGEGHLDYTIMGKPTDATFSYGEKVLQAYNEMINAELGTIRSIKTVYMIGDNPESDIKGANLYKSRFGADWKSILVESGVYEPGTKPAHEPTFVARDVKDAVDKALAWEGIDIGTKVENLTSCNGMRSFTNTLYIDPQKRKEALEKLREVVAEAPSSQPAMSGEHTPEGIVTRQDCLKDTVANAAPAVRHVTGGGNSSRRCSGSKISGSPKS